MAFLDPSIRSEAAGARDPGLFQEIVDFMRQFVIAAFDPYRPEQHYMRGPGPAWHAKHDEPASGSARLD
ncbi:hypothetical protein [Bradyrhizobium prioriisuperbiae]|uniref:hypothetical protein n=1 Tax=Bradyrhizobium prioriisuperbiae TaxID=2854389 RepID=UPI0028E311A6|nr:hypothetical protein [Bradyrhizobium prioritasuperba]